MNEENALKLIAFFEAGAPHVKFDMRSGLVVSQEEFDLDEPLPLAHCGSSACIAGIASQLALEEATSSERKEWWDEGAHDHDFIEVDGQRSVEVSWDQVRSTALEWLGLTPPRGPAVGQFNWDRHIGHPLFDLNRCPDNPTPKEAIMAIRGCMTGKKDPWRAVVNGRTGQVSSA